MLQAAMQSRAIKIVYGAVFPITVIALLLGVASFNNRPMLLGSITSDLLIRLMLAAWFCGLYIRLSRFSSFSVFPNKQWSKADVGKLEKYFYIGMGCLFGLGCGLITWWVVQWFLPGFSKFVFAVAAFNGLAVSLPMMTQYWVLKL